jgi:integrase
LRLGELVALRWRDVDLDRRVLRVCGSWSGTELTLPHAGNDLVFPGAEARYLDRSALRRRYRRAQAAAGLRPLRFHDLRHTFATTMIARTSIRRVQE